MKIKIETHVDTFYVSPGSYARAWRQAREDVESGDGDRVYKMARHDDSLTANELLLDFRRGLRYRINRHIPGFGVGRHWNDDTGLRHLAYRLNNNLAVRECEIPRKFIGRIRRRTR